MRRCSERSAQARRRLTVVAAEKDYLAIVYGRVNVGRGTIDLWLRHDPGDRRRMIASPDTGARSLTRFERIARVGTAVGGLSLLKCQLLTGRTHQIRVHLAARGWPIVGDPVYGEPRWSHVRDPALCRSASCISAAGAARVAPVVDRTRSPASGCRWRRRCRTTSPL